MLKQLERPTGKVRAAGKTPISKERTVITPDIASAFLDKNFRNRKPRRRHIEKLARDMRGRRWVYTGDPIRFDEGGNLIDGQHRLLACIESDTPFESEVMYGLPASTQDVLDTGAGRLTSDIMSLNGYHYALTLSAACRMLLVEASETTFATARRVPFTSGEVNAVLDTHPALPSSVNYCGTFTFPRGINKTQVSVMHYIGTHLLGHKKIADAFVDVIISGVPTYPGDAAHAYRERILKRAERDTNERWQRMKHAWNAFVVGEPAKSFRSGAADVAIDGVTPEMLRDGPR